MTASTNEREIEELEELTELLAVVVVAWVSLVGVLWLYWASGGTTGVWTLWGGSTELSGIREPWIESLLWAMTIIAFALAALALSTASQWKRVVPRRLLVSIVFLLGVTLLPSFVVELVLRGFVLIAILDSTALKPSMRTWRLLFWNPWWILTVLLFCIMTWLDQYANSQPTTATE